MKKQYVITALVSITLLIAGGLFFKMKKNTKPVAEIAEQPKNFGFDEDVLVLKNKGADSNRTYLAAVRLSELRRPEAKTWALEFFQSQDAVLRRAAAFALGYYDGVEVELAQKKLLKDKDPEIRYETLLALSKTPNKNREILLEETYKEASKGSLEKLGASISLHNINKTPSFRKQKIDEFLQWSNQNQDIERRALSAAIEYGGTSAEVKSHLAKILKSEQGGWKKALAIRHLAMTKEKTLVSSLDQLLISRDESVRLAALQSLHVICPENRWQILEKFLMSNPPSNLANAAMFEAFLLFEEPTKEFIMRVPMRFSQDQVLQRNSRMLLEKIDQGNASASCKVPGSF